MSAETALRSIGIALASGEDATPDTIARDTLRALAERDALLSRFETKHPTLEGDPVPSLWAVETWLRAHCWTRQLATRDGVSWTFGGRYIFVDTRPGSIALRAVHMARVAEVHGMDRGQVLTEMLALDAPAGGAA